MSITQCHLLCADISEIHVLRPECFVDAIISQAKLTRSCKPKRIQLWILSHESWMSRACSYLADLNFRDFINLNWLIEILTLRRAERSILPLSPRVQLPSTFNQSQAVIISSSYINYRQILETFNQTWQSFWMDELISVLVAVFQWFTNSKLAELVASHCIYVPRWTQHYGVWDSTSNISYDSVEAADFGCHGRSLDTLAVDLRVTGSGQVADA